MLCIMLSSGDTTVNSKRLILALMIYSVRKDFVYYRSDVFPTSVK